MSLQLPLVSSDAMEDSIEVRHIPGGAWTAPCKDCVILCTHWLRHPECTALKVQLHDLRGQLHISVEQFATCDPEAERITSIRVELDGATTEYSTDFYAAYLASLEPPGMHFVKEAPQKPVVPPPAPPLGPLPFTAEPEEMSMMRMLAHGDSWPPPKPVARDIPLEVLSTYFHLPINDACKALGICSTSLKKICRRHGVVRWPHRKVKSMESKLAKVEDLPKLKTEH